MTAASPSLEDTVRDLPRARAPLRLLHLVAAEQQAVLMAERLKREHPDSKLVWVSSAAALAEAASRGGPFDAILAEHQPPAIDAATAARLARALQPQSPVFVVSTRAGIDVDAAFARAGAARHLPRTELAALPRLIRDALAGAAAS